MKKKRWIVLVIAGVVAVALAIAFRIAQGGRASKQTAIRVSGNIEATVAQVSFKTAGRVARRWVAEGETVTNGQVVASLDRIELEQELAMRRAEALTAQAALDELEAGARLEEIEEVSAQLEVARAEARRAENERARQKELFENNATSAREFEAADAAARAALARVEEGQARLTLLKKGPRKERIAAARARLEQGRQAVALAETRLNDATLASPLSGVVLAKGIEDGEYVVPGTPVITVGDLEHVWLRSYLNETDLGRVTIGQSVEVRTDTYPGRTYTGRLSFISSQAEFTPKNVQTTKERVKLVYRIKVDLANPDQSLKPGMPADAEIAIE